MKLMEIERNHLITMETDPEFWELLQNTLLLILWEAS